jgi:hypothetical protein
MSSDSEQPAELELAHRVPPIGTLIPPRDAHDGRPMRPRRASSDPGVTFARHPPGAPPSQLPTSAPAAEAAAARPSWLPKGMPDLAPLSPLQRAIVQEARGEADRFAPWSVVPGYVETQRSVFFHQEDLDLLRQLAWIDRSPKLDPYPGLVGAVRTRVRDVVLKAVNRLLRFWHVRQAQLNHGLVSAAIRAAALERRVGDLEREIAELKAARAGRPS